MWLRSTALAVFAAVSCLPASAQLIELPQRDIAMACRDREGFAAMVAIPISSKNQVLGVFNLFFRSPRALRDNEVRLLETVGQGHATAYSSLASHPAPPGRW